MLYSLLIFTLVTSCLGQSNDPIPDEVRHRLDTLAGLGQYGKAFELFQDVFGKSYVSTEETAKRQVIFRDNYRFIQQNNELELSGQITYSLGMNWFGDLS